MYLKILITCDRVSRILRRLGRDAVRQLRQQRSVGPTVGTEEVEIPKVDEMSEEENKIPVNDAELAEEEEGNHDNPKYDKLEAEIPANNADVEVDVGREEILTDEEVERRTNPEGDEVLEMVEEEIVGEEILESVTKVKDLESLDHAVPVILGDFYTHEGKQYPREEVHAQSGTQEASKQNAPRREGESDALFNRPRHHSTDTKADALRMSDVENGKARKRTRSPPGKMGRVDNGVLIKPELKNDSSWVRERK
ncbi:hypothetical protein FQA39_LY05203 [Lamprigera yunnana]|nr:hypothetical protein FQA39_LY05203 [Lamprigera yunnana]